MHVAKHRGQLQLATIFLIALTLGSLSQSGALGQDAQTPQQEGASSQIEALVADLKQRGRALEELSQKVGENPEGAAAMLEKEVSDRRARYRRDIAKLVQLVVDAEDAGTRAAQGRAIATAFLKQDAKSMREKLEETGRESVALVDVATKGSPDEAQKARSELSRGLSTSTRLIKYLDTNIDQQEMLGLDVKADIEYLVSHLKIRADVTSGVLQSTKEEIDEIATRAGADTDAEAQKLLASLKKQRNALAESQRANVQLMDEYGLETAQLRQGIIVATGKLSQDIFDKDVASGLADAWLEDAADWLRTNGASLVFQVLAFVLLLFAFWIAARIGRGLVRRAIDRSKLQVSSLARDFFIKMTGRLILLFGFIIAIAQLGIEVAPLLAGLGIAGFIIGFALQDTLSNFASGMMILVYRPFDEGDVVEAGGVIGKVDKMNLVSTMVLTFDNQLLVVPNKQIWGGVIRNVTHKNTRRVDMQFGIGYSDNVQKAEQLLTEIVTGCEKVLKDPAPVIKLHELGDSSLNFIVRPWSKTDEYWDVYWHVTREVKRRFDEEGISIPFPQRDVHIYREDGGDAEA
ncbi:MAG: mechanosensitive ion channel [Myxococcales bacterium]|nr:mechanosensitive ion channel [Myxococcales bacterium]NNK06441.1 mechanosensitive ion channel [Myxococcales bacterium]RZV51707.1 MAG: mechanosensitive ion channel [Deltaproteobacteria bacterium]